MYEMQTIVTDDPSVSLSVTRITSVSLCKNGWTDQDQDVVWVAHSWEPMEHCARRGSWSPKRGGSWGKILPIVDQLRISQEWLKVEIDLKFYAHTDGRERKLCKTRSQRVGGGDTWPNANFCNLLHISGTDTTIRRVLRVQCKGCIRCSLRQVTLASCIIYYQNLKNFF